MKRILPTIVVKIMVNAAKRSIKTPTLKTAFQPTLTPAIKAMKNSKYRY